MIAFFFLLMWNQVPNKLIHIDLKESIPFQTDGTEHSTTPGHRMWRLWLTFKEQLKVQDDMMSGDSPAVT